MGIDLRTVPLVNGRKALFEDAKAVRVEAVALVSVKKVRTMLEKDGTRISECSCID